MITQKRKQKKKTKKLNNKKYIILEKYEKNILGVIIHIYKINFNTSYKCAHNLTLKKQTDYIKKYVVKNINLFDYLTSNKIFSKKIYKYDKKFTEKIIDNIDNFTNEKYTFCLNKNTLIFAETNHNKSFIKEFMTKHIMLCDDTACASGEMVINNNLFIFDNSSGTFKPSVHNLQSIKQALPFLHVKITNMNSKTREIIFTNK